MKEKELKNWFMDEEMLIDFIHFVLGRDHYFFYKITMAGVTN